MKFNIVLEEAEEGGYNVTPLTFEKINLHHSQLAVHNYQFSIEDYIK